MALYISTIKIFEVQCIETHHLTLQKLHQWLNGRRFIVKSSTELVIIVLTVSQRWEIFSNIFFSIVKWIHLWFRPNKKYMGHEFDNAEVEGGVVESEE